MRIYEGSPRQDFEEVFRSIGAFIDQRGDARGPARRGARRVHRPGHRVVRARPPATWSESMGTQTKETLTFLDDDIARFMEEAVARRGQAGRRRPIRDAGYYETAFRVLGRYMDEQKPRDVFFFEQDGAFVVRLLMAGPAGQPARPRRVHSRGHRRDGRPGPTLRGPASPARKSKPPAA